MMMMRRAIVCLVCAAGLLTAATPASAQYGVRRASSTAIGEDYHIEFSAGLWNPTPEIVVSSESLGIVGTEINAVTDLGFEKEQFPDIKLVLRPSTKFKFRLGYTPIKYEAETILQRTITFNGQAYQVGLPVNSDFDWKSWRFGLEYDFVYGSRGFAGFIVEAKYTDLDISLTSPIVGLEFTKVKVPVPTIGGIARVYVLPNTSITAEVTGLKLSYDDNEGKYLDVDIYGTFNFMNNIGAQFGYRALNVDYIVEDDRGDLQLKGVYFGGVVRF